ncbi:MULTISPECIES: histidine kinase [unclassified Nocardioides]|uniref:histidine kinase n=1 Tax=unclassified Nocardioides TaxID=2615069 RepID=UPI000701A5A1|nr:MULTISPECIES: histidine kinase [unclassified Nocardioides]KRA38136.1 histidine kinase [Nocardioides sp. Root614]KRA92096.1 histidine kinase [Nocardioides sp. Root682]
MDGGHNYQPRLYWYSHVWRYVLALLIGLLTWVSVVQGQFNDHRWLLVADILVGIVALVLVWWRRRWPMTIAVVTVLLTPLTSIGAGAIMLATVSVATRRHWWQVIVLGTLNLAMTWVYYQVQPVSSTSDPSWLIAVFIVVFVAAALAWGMFIGSRRELVWTLRQRAETAEAERDLRANQARSTERARIAREMHDVLAHRISQISLHAGALTFREDLTAEEMRSSVAVIQTKAHEALSDLREVLGVLRDEASGAPLTGPQPTYGDLAALLQDARDAGASIEYDDRLAPSPPLPDAAGRTVYRIVQEGITNASKHAPAATLRISIEGSPEAGVDLVLRNPVGFGPTRTPGAGLGLVGLTERAELRGGWLAHGIEDPVAGPPDTQSFVLRTWLPWDPADSATGSRDDSGSSDR